MRLCFASWALMGCLCVAVPSAVCAQESKAFERFSDLRTEILSLVGKATQRVWLVTGSLTDGEIVTAFYVAQYRKVQVQVLLGKQKANHYMSRLNYLKAQNIAVFLKPDEMKLATPTVFMADDQLFLIDIDLDFQEKRRLISMKLASEAERERFIAGFAKATNQAIPAIPRPLPIVGKARFGTSRPPPPGSVYGGRRADHDDAFIYDSSSAARHAAPPPGVARKLPKETIQQQRTRIPIAAESQGDRKEMESRPAPLIPSQDGGQVSE